MRQNSPETPVTRKQNIALSATRTKEPSKPFDILFKISFNKMTRQKTARRLGVKANVICKLAKTAIPKLLDRLDHRTFCNVGFIGQNGQRYFLITRNMARKQLNDIPFERR